MFDDKKLLLEVLTPNGQRMTFKLARKHFLSPVSKGVWSYKLDGERFSEVHIDGDINLVRQTIDTEKGKTIHQIQAAEFEPSDDKDHKKRILKVKLSGVETVVDASLRYAKQMENLSVDLNSAMQEITKTVRKTAVLVMKNVKSQAQFSAAIAEEANKSFEEEEEEQTEEVTESDQTLGKQSTSKPTDAESTKPSEQQPSKPAKQAKSAESKSK